MYLASIDFSDFDATATILEALMRPDDETDIDDTDTDSDTIDHQ